MNNLKDEVYQKIGARIREVRIEKKMSQADLAEKAHMSLPHISEIELGKTRMLLSTFVQITEALQVSADSLLRPNTPESKNIYTSEFASLLSDCTPAEIDSILKIVKEVKASMHSKKDIFDY